MTIKVNIDNTHCDTAVRNFKVRLYRKILAIAHTKKGPVTYKKSEVIHEEKFPGISGKTKDEKMAITFSLMQTISSQ